MESILIAGIVVACAVLINLLLVVLAIVAIEALEVHARWARRWLKARWSDLWAREPQAVEKVA